MNRPVQTHAPSPFWHFLGTGSRRWIASGAQWLGSPVRWQPASAASLGGQPRRPAPAASPGGQPRRPALRADKMMRTSSGRWQATDAQCVVE